LQATIDLLLDRGYRGLSIEAIAERVGVSKVTIYRWWPHKAAVAMDAFLAFNEPKVRFPDTGSAREDFRRQMPSHGRFFAGPGGQLLRVLIAEAQHDRQLAEDVRTRFMAKRRADGRQALQRGIDRGELRHDLEPEVVIDALYAPAYLRLLIGHEPIDEALYDALIGYVFDGIAVRPPDGAQHGADDSAV